MFDLGHSKHHTPHTDTENIKSKSGLVDSFALRFPRYSEANVSEFLRNLEELILSLILVGQCDCFCLFYCFVNACIRYNANVIRILSTQLKNIPFFY